MNEGKFETIILKMENSIRNTSTFRQIFLNVNSNDEFIFKKSDFLEFFFSIEEEIREFIQFTKSFNNINQDLQDELLTLQNKTELYEYKIMTLEESQMKLRESMSELVNQLQILDDRDLKNKEYIKELENNLNDAEKKLRNKNEQINNLKNNSLDYQRSELYEKNKNNSDLNIVYKDFIPSEPISSRDDKKFPNEMKSLRSGDNFFKTTDMDNVSIIKSDYDTKITKPDEIITERFDTFNQKSSNSKRINTLDNSKQDVAQQKSRGQRVVDIVLKINSSDPITNILNKLYGSDVLDRIMSPETQEDFINEIEETINGIENLIQKEKTKNKHDVIEEKDEEDEILIPKNDKIIKRNISSTNITPIKTDFRFEDSLRKSNNPPSSSKIYKPYAKVYGNYFDPGIMKGGESILKPARSSRSKTKSNNSSIISTKSNPVKIDNRKYIFCENDN